MRPHRLLSVLFTFVLAGVLSTLAPASVHAATVLYVRTKGSATDNCTSWTDSCTLQRALAIAVSVDQIWVAVGTHKPSTNQTDTFRLKNGVTLYGGFVGNETALSQRDIVAHPTTLT